MYVAEATILFAGAFEPEEARLTESNIYKDGSMIIRLDNATTIKLCHTSYTLLSDWKWYDILYE
jgi:hypothetical protein